MAIDNTLKFHHSLTVLWQCAKGWAGRARKPARFFSKLGLTTMITLIRRQDLHARLDRDRNGPGDACRQQRQANGRYGLSQFDPDRRGVVSGGICPRRIVAEHVRPNKKGGGTLRPPLRSTIDRRTTFIISRQKRDWRAVRRLTTTAGVRFRRADGMFPREPKHLI